MNPLSEIITNEIQKSGIMPFSRFMELALYCPVYGYYDKETDKIGRRGDFFTNVSVGNVFGELLAFQFAEWLQTFPPDRDLYIIEAGAHDGSLARDILTWLTAHRADLFPSLRYLIIEPSPRRREWQQHTLSQFKSVVHWAANLFESKQHVASGQRGPQRDGLHGIIFSNELLDAMPVRRWGWDAKNRNWFEWGVCLDSGTFVWRKTNPSDVSAAPQVPEALRNVLPDEYIAETCPAAAAWWAEAARLLECGHLLTIDYGLITDELWKPERRGGTLRTYSRHHSGGDPLSNVGGQDITAHVNFTTLEAIGESQGLKTEALMSQEKFLTGIAARAESGGSNFGEWTPERMRQFKTLIHPEHLGRAFRVLTQSRAACNS
jgi:SAM-dependent MidA family methyltransferase